MNITKEQGLDLGQRAGHLREWVRVRVRKPVWRRVRVRVKVRRPV